MHLSVAFMYGSDVPLNVTFLYRGLLHLDVHAAFLYGSILQFVLACWTDIHIYKYSLSL